MRFKNSLRIAATLAVVGVLGLSHQGDASAAALKSTVELTVRGNLSSSLDLTNVASPLVMRRAIDFGTGTGAANVLWSARRTLASAATDSLDFAGGGLVDALGVAVAPARIRAVIIYSLGGPNGNTTNLTLFGDANGVPILNTPATTTTLTPGGMFVATNPSPTGFVVTAATGDIIKIVNGSGAPAKYDIVIIGASS